MDVQLLKNMGHFQRKIFDCRFSCLQTYWGHIWLKTTQNSQQMQKSCCRLRSTIWYTFFLDEADEQNGSQTIEESGLNVKQELEPLSATVNGEKVQMIQLEKLIDWSQEPNALNCLRKANIFLFSKSVSNICIQCTKLRNQHYAQGLNDQLTETSFTVAQKMHHWQISKANMGGLCWPTNLGIPGRWSWVNFLK